MSWQHLLSVFLEIFEQFESPIEQRLSNFNFYVFGKFSKDQVTKTLKAFLSKQTFTWKVILDTLKLKTVERIFLENTNHKEYGSIQKEKGNSTNFQVFSSKCRKDGKLNSFLIDMGRLLPLGYCT